MIDDIFAHVTSHYPEHRAVFDGKNNFTYRELYVKQQQLVRYLIDELQIGKGEKIVLFLPNCVEFILSFFAIAEVGAIVVPLNIHLKEKELRYYIEKCGISAVITDSYLLSQWGKIPSHLQAIQFILFDKLDILSKNILNSLSPENDFHPSMETSLDDEFLYLSTSGSTGRPKIIPRTHYNVIAGAENVGNALEVTNQDMFLSVTPFFHANGLSNCMFLPIMKGASIFLMRQFSPRNMLRLIQENNITVLFGSPFIFSTLSDIADRTFCFPSLRFCLSTGAPMPKGLGKIFFSKFGIPVRQLYGSSETGTISIQLGDFPEDESSVGRPLNTVTVKIINKDGRELPPYEVGEIVVKSPVMIKGYVDEPELNKEAFSNGYFKTEDLGMFDRHGNLYISGRGKKFINVAGIKIDPLEIENVLLSFHKVRAVFVTGVKNRRGTEMIKAMLVAQPDCSVSEVIAYCKDKLAEYKIPRIIEFKDEIHRDIMGKVAWQ